MIKKSILGTFIAITAIATLVVGTQVLAGVDRSSKNSSDAQLASTTLVFSQVFGGGGGTTGTYSADYVEIKNVSAVPQSLDTLRIMYGSATGQFGSSAGNIYALPNTTLAPGQYFLIQLGTVGAGGLPVPSPDVTNTSMNLGGASGKMALVTAAFTGNTCGATATPCTLPNANMIDVVAYGVANNAEGGTSVNNGSVLVSTEGAVRKTGGCTDTDNNNLDFDVVTAPVPRNMATTPAPCGAAPTGKAPVDFDGDGKTDYSVVRNVGGGSGGQVRWYWNINGSVAPTAAADWGLATDFFISGDYDGDGKDDIVVWRPGAATVATYYILNSATSTLRQEAFGQTGDDVTVVGDYNGDGKDDLAVYRAGATAGAQSTWYFRTVANGAVSFVPWGVNGDFPAPGDYDGNGKADFGIQRNAGGGQAGFWILSDANVAQPTVIFGTPTDLIVPGDYDGDGKTDIATVRGVSGAMQWQWRNSSDAAINYRTFGASATDFPVQGDYDGDGKTDVAIWRPTAGANAFWSLGTSSNAVTTFAFGANGDFPIANYNAH
ncbi:MAG: VCBS repeat-containing protein [Chloracidobacterium sp.]|nr:VCBS repeat-containing protein [Chloracidobacterium sp.]MBK9437183.1 VCBS repeat-containing protein [Chloracidobacterium sp.]